MDPDRRQELIAWAKEALVPIRAMAEGRPVDRRELLEAVRQFVYVVEETGILDELPSPSGKLAPDREANDEELLHVALMLAAEIRAEARSRRIVPTSAN